MSEGGIVEPPWIAKRDTREVVYPVTDMERSVELLRRARFGDTLLAEAIGAPPELIPSRTTAMTDSCVTVRLVFEHGTPGTVVIHLPPAGSSDDGVLAAIADLKATLATAQAATTTQLEGIIDMDANLQAALDREAASTAANTDAAAANTSTMNTIVQSLKDLSDQILASGGDAAAAAAAVNGFADTLDQNTATIVANNLAGTPAAPTTPPDDGSGTPV